MKLFYCKHNPRCEVTTAVRLATRLLRVQFFTHVKQSLIRHVTLHNVNANGKLERSHCVCRLPLRVKHNADEHGKKHSRVLSIEWH